METLFLKYWAYQLTLKGSNRNISDLAVTLNNVKIDMNPKQIAAVNDCLRSLRENNGVILADEVGLGKTIEAGIIISKLWQSGKRKILIITPSGLIEQWCKEMSEKFHFKLKVVDGRFMRGNKPPNPFISENSKDIIICSYHFASNKVKYLSGLPFDLCCIDEAHNLRNHHGKRSSNIRNALKDIPKLLLTATPIQNSINDLYSLVAMIDQYFPIGTTKIPDNIQSLRSRWEPLLVRNLRRDSGINFVERITMTRNFNLNDSEKALYEAVEGFLFRDNLHCMRQGNRQLVKMTLRRLLASCPSNLASALKRLKKRLLDIDKIHEGLPKPNSSMSQKQLDELERLGALKRQYKQKLSQQEIKLLKAEAAELDHLHSLAVNIEDNSKSEALIYALREGLKQTVANGGSRKAVIFTEFLQTQQHIEEILKAIPEFKNKTVLINGGNINKQSKKIYSDWLEKYRNSDRFKNNPNIDRKTALLDYFESKADILIATEAASEGLNLQFCSLLINYDLPWNPQRIEQRIGRCHRYGQKNDVVVINFMNLDNLAETRLLNLLERKLKLFEKTLGQSNAIIDLKDSFKDGKDFEQWVGEVFLKCRTAEEINKAFNEKNAEIESQEISDDWKDMGHIFNHPSPDITKMIEDNRNKVWAIFKYVYQRFEKLSDKTMSFEIKKRLNYDGKDGRPVYLNRGKYTLMPNCRRRGFKYLDLKSHVVQGPLIEARALKPKRITKMALKFQQPGDMDIPKNSHGAIRVFFAKCKCYYEYERLIHVGYFRAGGEFHEMPENAIISLLESPYVFTEATDKFNTKLLKKISQIRLDEEHDFLQNEYDHHIQLIKDRMERWSREKRNHLRLDLDNAQRILKESKSSDNIRKQNYANIKFKQKWHQYNNDIAELEHKKYMTLLQAKNEYSPCLDKEILFTIHWQI